MATQSKLFLNRGIICHKVTRRAKNAIQTHKKGVKGMKNQNIFSIGFDVDWEKHSNDIPKTLEITEYWEKVKQNLTTIGNKATIILSIHDWQRLISNPMDIQKQPLVKGVTIEDIIHTKPFKVYFDKLASGVYPEGTALIFTLKNTEEGIIMADINAVIGTKREPIDIGIIIKCGELELSKNIRIEIPNLAKCPECGIEFTPLTKKQIYCSTRCAGRVRARRFALKNKLNVSY
jgi:hypothetical protein